MGRVIQPGSSTTGSSGQSSRPFFVIRLIRQYGFRAAFSIVVAALIAFVPLAGLIWFNFFRVTSIVSIQCGSAVVVKPLRSKQDQEGDEPGDTALLIVTCDVPTIDGWKELLSDKDRDNTADDRFHSIYVRDELVYLRKAGISDLPFGLLGSPPVSVWLPAGDYEIAVVHAAPHDRSLIDSPRTGFPLITMFDACTVPKSQKTIRRIQLPHYDWGTGLPVSIVGEVGSESTPPQPNLIPVEQAVEKMMIFPTPGGYVLFLEEPQLIHSDEHRECKADFENLAVLPREWTRNQLATLRRWLPREAIEARERLTPLVVSLLRREMFQGWFAYGLAGFAGLVLTKWGSFAILEPNQRPELLRKTAKFCIAIFIASAIGWWFAGQI